MKHAVPTKCTCDHAPGLHMDTFRRRGCRLCACEWTGIESGPSVPLPEPPAAKAEPPSDKRAMALDGPPICNDHGTMQQTWICAKCANDDRVELVRLAAKFESISAQQAEQIAALEATIEAVWFGIEHSYNIEPRAVFEAEAKTNGFKYGLAQAIHAIWKRNPKVEQLEAQNRALREALTDAQMVVCAEYCSPPNHHRECRDISAALATPGIAPATPTEQPAR